MLNDRLDVQAMKAILGAMRLLLEQAVDIDRVFISSAVAFNLADTPWGSELRLDGTLDGYTTHVFKAPKMIAQAISDSIVDVHEDMRARVVERCNNLRGETRLRLVLEKRWCAPAVDPPLVAVGPWLPLINPNTHQPMHLDTGVVSRIIIPNFNQPDRYMPVVEE